MTLTLHHNKDWPSAQAVRIAFLEAGMQEGQDYVLQNVDIAAGATDTAAFRALSPQGELPVLVDTDADGHGTPVTVFEGIAISAHVWQKRIRLQLPGDTFFPTDPDIMPRAFAWASWSRGHLTPYIETLLLNGKVLPAGSRDGSKVGPALVSFKAAVALLEGQVPGAGGFMARGAQSNTGKLSFADALIGASLTYARGIPQTKHTYNNYPKVDAYLKSLEARPSFQTAFGTQRDPINIP